MQSKQDLILTSLRVLSNTATRLITRVRQRSDTRVFVVTVNSATTKVNELLCCSVIGITKNATSYGNQSVALSSVGKLTVVLQCQMSESRQKKQCDQKPTFTTAFQVPTSPALLKLKNFYQTVFPSYTLKLTLNVHLSCTLAAELNCFTKRRRPENLLKMSLKIQKYTFQYFH